MKHIVILGAGTAGTTVANHLLHRVPSDTSITVVDPEKDHLFQPDLIFLPFGMQRREKMSRPRSSTLKKGIRWIQDSVERVDPDSRRVVLAKGDDLSYDILVIASGSHVHPEETEGLQEEHWYRNIFDFYTLEGATRLGEALSSFEGGRLVVNVVENPIKCPVAPLEFLFLADAYFTGRGLRDQVEIVYATPLDGAFTKPIASRQLGHMLNDRGILVEAEFNTASVDGDGRVLRSWDEREVPYDLLVSIPTHMGAGFLTASGLGDELGFVPTNHHSLLADGHDDIFVLGDATNLPTSKAGSVAHFEAEVVVENILHALASESLVAAFDGHANCFVETGFGKAMLIDFNYQVEPLPGTYPLPMAGPFTLLSESRRNHWGKLAFRWVYWNMLLPGRNIPVPNRMSMAGKRSSLLEKATA